MVTLLTATDTDMDTTARDLLMLSPAMATTAAATVTDTATVMAAATTARGPLMPSQDMATTAIGMEVTTEDITVTDTATATDTTAENPEVHVDSIRLEFSTNEFRPSWS